MIRPFLDFAGDGWETTRERLDGIRLIEHDHFWGHEEALELSRRHNLLEPRRSRGMRVAGARDPHDVRDIATYAAESDRPVGEIQELFAELKAWRLRPVELRPGSRPGPQQGSGLSTGPVGLGREQ